MYRWYEWLFPERGHYGFMFCTAMLYQSCINSFYLIKCCIFCFDDRVDVYFSTPMWKCPQVYGNSFLPRKERLIVMGGVREIENSNERFKYFKVQSIYISSKRSFQIFLCQNYDTTFFFLLHQKEEIWLLLESNLLCEINTLTGDNSWWTLNQTVTAEWEI